jgi:hypothetical protein
LIVEIANPYNIHIGSIYIVELALTAPNIKPIKLRLEADA